MKIFKAEKHQGINPAGDCGPCCLSGLTGISVREIYDNYFTRIDGTSYGQMLAACWKLYWEKKIQWVTNKLCVNNKIQDPEYSTFGNPSWENFNEWLRHVITMTNQGYVGIAEVEIHGKAPGELKYQFMTNHWVLITGGEDGLLDNNDKRLIHVSCPSRGEYSIHPLEFLINYGGYNVIWVLPLNDGK